MKDSTAPAVDQKRLVRRWWAILTEDKETAEIVEVSMGEGEDLKEGWVGWVGRADGTGSCFIAHYHHLSASEADAISKWTTTVRRKIAALSAELLRHETPNSVL